MGISEVILPRLKSKILEALCLIVIGTEGAAPKRACSIDLRDPQADGRQPVSLSA